MSKPITTRDSFVSDLQGKQASVRELAEGRDAITHAGRADINRDGFIAGTDELNRLFDILDRSDVSATGAVQERQDGRATAVGRQLNALRPKFTPSATAPKPSGLTRGERMTQGGHHSMMDSTERHRAAVNNTGIGTRYGVESEFKKMTEAQRQAWIVAHTTGGTPPTPRESSCIGWALEHVGAAYERAGMGARWQEILRIVRANGVRGTVLAEELQKDGWQAIYFNPDTRDTRDNGEHSYTAHITRERPDGSHGEYYGVRVHDRIVNSSGRDASTHEGLRRLASVDFYFGLAHGGEHTFVGGRGQVNEFHWTANPDDRLAMEESSLDTFTSSWRSGVILVPPGTWPSR